MLVSSLVAALGLMALVHADHPAVYLVVWVLTGVATAASLYDSAFATLGRIFGSDARPADERVSRLMSTIDIVSDPLSMVWDASRLLSEGVCQMITRDTGTNVVAVTHKPNILDAFGKDWFEVREGEASLFKPDGIGGSKLVARVQADDWMKLAQSAN
jgi:hypothetical protein